MLKNKTLFTPTMAKVLESQGYLSEALQIYSHLLDRIPGHKAFQDKVVEIEARLDQESTSEDKVAVLFDEWLALALGFGKLERLRKLRPNGRR